VGQKRKTHCKNGHERTPEHRRADGRCRECFAAYERKWRERHPRQVQENSRRNNRKNRLAGKNPAKSWAGFAALADDDVRSVDSIAAVTREDLDLLFEGWWRLR